ncbi:MAG: mandelate racemase/muconate lactonizing enzyme family protein, partial [Rhodospirillales bacterium]
MTISIHGVDVFACRAPIDFPVITSFGTMYDRPAVIIRLRDADGHIGWGEIWCNYPTCGAEHRARLVETVFAPLLLKMDLNHPEDIYNYLTNATHTLAIQTAEIGPIAQVISGIDIAIWDIFARRNNKPLYEVLGGKINTIPVYASGINSSDAEKTINLARGKGFNAFKVKVGFGHDEDIETINKAYVVMSKTEKLMVDANQAWTFEEAADFLNRVESIPLEWLEEPIQADRPDSEWQELCNLTTVPIAAGENIRGFDNFNNRIKNKTLGVIQP